jgi:RimJ/RimL family protein N-acetyltransferase
MIPILTTDRLTLRAISMTDWDAYAAMWADERVTTFIGGEPRPRDVAWMKFCQSIGLWSLLGYGYWTVLDRAQGGFLGIAGFAQFERGYPALGGYPEAGWAFVADAWGRGIASETVAAILIWADKHLPADETRCMIDHGNPASAAVAQRNGYVLTDELANGMPVFRRRAPSPANPA